MIRESEILRMCRDIPKDAVGLFEIYACMGKMAKPPGTGQGWGNSVRNRNRVLPVRNIPKGTKSAIELFLIVGSTPATRTNR